MSRTTVTEKTQSQRSIVEDPSPLGINPDSKFGEEVPVYDHSGEKSLRPHLEYYEEAEDNNITLGNLDQKAAAAFEVMQKSQAVVVEVEPWFVNTHMGTEDFDRWEPFFVAFPEVTTDRQMKFTNLAPLSEVAYRISQRDSFLEEAQANDLSGESTDSDSVPDETDGVSPIVKAQIEEQKAFTRYTLDAFYNGEPKDDGSRPTGAWVDLDPIHAVHTCLSPWAEHLIIGMHDDGSLYCGRGSLFDKHVDIAIDLDRRINEHGERKAAVYNDKSKKDAMNSLDFDETHARYLGEKARWEVDLAELETVVRELLSHESISYVSMHRITEKAYVTHLNPQFRHRIDGYPGFDQ